MKTFLEKELTEYKCLPTGIWDTKCFACGKNNPEGLHMKFYTDEKSVFSELVISETKRGWDQVVHGGILSTILDEIMAWAAIYLTENIMLTKNMTVNYIKPVHIEKQISTIGWLHERKGPREAVLKAEIYDENNQLCTEAVGTYALFSTKLAKKLQLMNEESLNKFEEFIEACNPMSLSRQPRP
jgi:uncharacterized protein (TIGR00369 family)